MKPKLESRGLTALAEVLSELGSKKVLLVSGPNRRFVDRVKSQLVGVALAEFNGAATHVPQTTVAEASRKLAEEQADTIVTIGGGSATGLGKALRLEHDLRFVAIPTTYAGSEFTTLHGTTDGGSKQTGRSPKVQPDVVVVDPTLFVGMPRRLTITSLLNALAHPLSALSTGNLDSEARKLALTAVRTLWNATGRLLKAPHDLLGRGEALRGTELAARCLEHGVGAQHRWAHTLGGRFDTDHSGLHAVLLPHFVRWLRGEQPALIDELSELLNVPDIEGRLHDLLVCVEAATSLKALGIDLGELREVLQNAELQSDVLLRAFHGRRPSARIRFEDFGLEQLVSVAGPKPETARRVVLAVHGRGSNADAIIKRVWEMTGDDPDVCVVAPQADNNAWYSAPYTAEFSALNPQLNQALADIEVLLARLTRQVDPKKIVLLGFSQGACLSLEVAARLEQSLGGVLALSGARIGPVEEQLEISAKVRDMPVLLGASDEDPYLGKDHVTLSAEAFSKAGAKVRKIGTSGDRHSFHALQRVAARSLLRGRADEPLLEGYANAHASEALPGAIPASQNTPQRSPYGLYPELISGSAFTAPRDHNRRVWLYRIRPAAEQRPFEPLNHATWKYDFSSAAPEVNLSGFAPLPEPAEPRDFVGGMATLGGSGSADLRRGFAIHLYAANRNMEERAFFSADSDLLFLPQQGSLLLMTEAGILSVHPSEVATLPRGMKCSVFLPDGWARGWVGEVFGRHFFLPERGPVGSNGLADARHFQAPPAWYEDRLSPGYKLVSKIGGKLYQAECDHSPFDVVAWHGNHVPYKYDLMKFCPVGNARFDHIDPSAHTVLSAPLDEPGVSSLDFVVFAPRWDVSEHSFRPPYFHRNATTEFNGVIRGSSSAPFLPGTSFLTPSMTPHGVVAESVERALRPSEAVERPSRLSDQSLWFQFETALPFAFTRWAQEAPGRLNDWPCVWGSYPSHFDPTQR